MSSVVATGSVGEILTAGSVTPSQLATRMRLSRAAVTKVVEKLSRAGYVRRGVDENDRPRTLLTPSRRLQRGIAEIYGPLAARMAAITEDFDEPEQSAIHRWLNLVTEIMKHCLDGME